MAESHEQAVDEALRRFFADLRSSRFFGIVELHFQAGRLVRVKKQEVFEPKDLIRR